MALIDDESVAKRASYRVKTAGTKLSRNELAALEEHCRKLHTTPGELIRKLIFAELGADLERPSASAELTEVIGLRLMLTNLLKPVATGQKITAEAFDGIMAEVKKRKKAVAAEARQEAEGV
jgi:DNA-binding Xre family transcriptional regulator